MHRLGKGSLQAASRWAVIQMVGGYLTYSGWCVLSLSGRSLLGLSVSGQQQPGQEQAGMALAWGRVMVANIGILIETIGTDHYMAQTSPKESIYL